MNAPVKPTDPAADERKAMRAADRAEVTGERRGSMSLELRRADASQEIAERYRDKATVANVVEDTVGVWGKKKWTTVEKLAPPDLARVARAIVTAFPDFGPLEITKYFDMLGGKLRETSEFWMHAAAAHPAYDGVELKDLQPDMPEWKEYIDLDPAIVAAATLAIVRRTDRATPFREASYVLHTDSMLADYQYVNLPGARNRSQAEAAAPKGYEKLFYDEPEQPGGPTTWKARIAVPKPDARALAKKKARTTATRRAIRVAFSLSEAKVTSLLGRVNHIIEQAQLRGDGGEDLRPWNELPDGTRVKAGGSVGRLIDEAEDPYLPQPTAAEVGHVDAIVDDQPAPMAEEARPLRAESHPTDSAVNYISEADRRHMYTWLEERQLSKGPHATLKEIVAQVQGKPVAEVSSKTVTYPEYERIRQVIERFPLTAAAGEPEEQPPAPEPPVEQGDAFEGRD